MKNNKTKPLETMALFDGAYARARNSDPETSHQAARSVTKIRETQQLILDLLKVHGPMTDEQIYALIPAGRMSPSGARSRRKELQADLHRIEDSGFRALTKAGRKTIIWRASI